MILPKDVAILTLTKHGLITATRVADSLRDLGIKCRIFAPKKFAKTGVVPIHKKLSELVGGIFDEVDAIVAIMAVGITIRAIAPHISSKKSDPAVLAIDDLGRHVVSLLSGHLGGANELTKVLAAKISATPVITTATDIMGKISVEVLAKQLHCDIENPEELTAVNSAIVNDERVLFALTKDSTIPLSDLKGIEITIVTDAIRPIDILKEYDAGVIITGNEVPIHKVKKPTIILRPRKIVVGIGTRKGIGKQSVISGILSALKLTGISLERVNCLATADIKKEELGIVSAARELSLPLEMIGLDEIRSFNSLRACARELSPASQVVMRKFGVGGICEPAALIAAGKKAKLILQKSKMIEGVTVAIAEGK